MNLCRQEDCKRVAQAGLEGLCLGHYYWQVYIPAQDAWRAARDKMRAAMARTPSTKFNEEVAKAKRDRRRYGDV